MNDRWAMRGARLIFALRLFDRAYNIISGAWSTVVLALASEALLDRYNDLAYAAGGFYRPDSASFYPHLFSWEQQAIERFFPPPPARLLIGAAGGGRESFILARRGYQVVAFEPARGLVEAMIAAWPREAPGRVYRARYADLPRLFPARLGDPVDNLETLGPFDAAIVGRNSFSHLRSEAERVAVLRDFAQITHGPILVSFHMTYADARGAETTLRRLQRIVLERSDRAAGDRFSANTGYHHEFSLKELTRLIGKARLKLVYLETNQWGISWPHAVLIPAPDHSQLAMQTFQHLNVRHSARQ
jgi:SAM-dependent methyltransferase